MLDSIETTKDIKIPKEPIERVIGQEEAVRIVKIAAKQRRNLLLIGPPGTGKSMVAQAMASLLPKPTQEISVIDNPENHNRPLVEIRTKKDIERENKFKKKLFKVIPAIDAPEFVAEKLGYRCKKCGFISSYKEEICPNCGAEKHSYSPFGDLVEKEEEELKEGDYIFQRYDENSILVFKFDKKLIKKRKVIVPLDRKTFVQATGASETELLGDVEHDPYGSHKELGSLPYTRVVAGAVHEAHEGVLFVDEIPTLGDLQRYILTAMQEKKYPIVGKNPTSTGAAVRVEDVPCDFILVAAANIRDLSMILPPLLSRITGNGYQVLMKTYMEATEENKLKLFQFIAQEIENARNIPHMKRDAMELIAEVAKKKAKAIDNANGYTLRLRDIAGLIRIAGDSAVADGSEFIEKKHVEEAIKNSKGVKESLKRDYGSLWKASFVDEGEENQANPSYA
ncbi:MAG: ATP-binding protein [Candidatus Micrarchaeales archaeon]|jgi:predicted ATP-dependent protease